MMDTFQITAPDGSTYNVTGETPEGAHAALMQMLGGQGQAAETPSAEPEGLFDKFRQTTVGENLIGYGEVDTTGERIGEAIRAGGAGLARGAIGTLELPEMAARGLLRLGQEAGQALGYDLPDTPVLDTATGRALRGGTAALVGEDELNFKGTSAPARYVGTAAEFLGGGGALGLAGKGVKAAGAAANAAKVQKAGEAAQRIGLGREAVKGATIAGVGSEALGQATEGTALEPAARVIGALAAPAVANKTVNLFAQKAATRPSVKALQSYKTAAYKAADSSGIKFSADEVDGLISKASSRLDDVNFDPDVDLQTKAALKSISNKQGQELSLGQLDKIRQGLSNRYGRSKKEVGILGLIDEIDNLIDTSTKGGELMRAARLANRKFKKAEILENAFEKALDKTATSGSGGNTVNKFRSAVEQIINGPQARSFSAEEIDVMRRFVRGDMPENALRLIGKLSPSGNGLMIALNVGAISAYPPMVAATVAGAASKVASERMAVNSIEAIKDMVASGTIPEAKKLVTDQQIRALLGLQAD